MDSVDQDQTASFKAVCSGFILFCYSDKHFVNFSPDNWHFIGEQEEKSAGNFRKFSACFTWPKYVACSQKNHLPQIGFLECLQMFRF